MIVLDMVIRADPCLAVTTFRKLDVEFEHAHEPRGMRGDRITLAVDGQWPALLAFKERLPVGPRMWTPRRQSTEQTPPHAAADAAAGTGGPLGDHNGCSPSSFISDVSCFRRGGPQAARKSLNSPRRRFRINRRIHEK
jgi:hypothetical protein